MSQFETFLRASAVGIVVAALVGAWWAQDRADARVRAAELQADSAETVRRIAEAEAWADSVALDSARAVAEAAEREIAGLRAEARHRAIQAAREASGAATTLRATLDSLGASTAALDRLEAAHAAEVAAVVQERDLADSTVVVLRGLLASTEAALASERTVVAAYGAETDALRAHVAALERGRRGDRITKAGLAALVLVAVLR